ncbi:MAG: extracellular solute-binding protein [Anaerolineaceae bacterium]|nr:extracellular solute-binding protein [Anaerolineaceae bacterium]
MSIIYLLLSVLVLTTALSGCDSINLSQILTPETQSPGMQPASTVLPETTPEINSANLTTTPLPQPILIWVPPEFDPNNGTRAGNLLQAQLDRYMQANPDIQVNVRVKTLSGPGGLMDSLVNTKAAAPSALPSLVILSRANLETAALKGLIIPLDQDTNLLEDEDWYDYARQLAQIQNTTFGFPFAGDAFILIYRAAIVSSSPTDWAEIFEYEEPILFPAADPMSFFTLNLYRSAGGNTENDQYQAILEQMILESVLSFYEDGVERGAFPYWLSQLETNEQTWQAYREKEANWLISKTSDFLTELPADTTAIPLPPLSLESSTLADGWLWAISNPMPEQRETSIKLAEYLVESEFLSQWTVAAGYLPVRPSVMEAWPNQSIRTLLSQVTLSAQIGPTNDIITSLAPILRDATLQIIRRLSSPRKAAQDAIDSLIIPQIQ